MKILPHLFKILFLVAFIGLAFWLGQIAKNSEFIQDIVRSFGYLGVFIISVISGFNLAVPIPAISFLPLFLESGLNILIILLIISTGMTLADMISHLIGKTGRQLTNVPNTKTFRYIEKWQNKKRWVPILGLFLFAAFAPLPNEVVLIPMGFLGYKKSEVIMPVFFGNLMFNAIYASAILSIYNQI